MHRRSGVYPVAITDRRATDNGVSGAGAVRDAADATDSYAVNSNDAEHDAGTDRDAEPNCVGDAEPNCCGDAEPFAFR